MASVSEQQAAQCASQHQDLCFGGLAESLERKIAEQMKNTTGSTQHAKTNTPFGVKALQGTRPNMEDAYSVQMTPPPATSSGTATTAAGAAAGADPQAGAGAVQAQPGPGTPPQQNLNGPSPEAPVLDEDDAANIPVPLLPEDLAVLSVFDGHGGNEVAEHCRESLHRHFAHQLSLQRATDDDSGDEASPALQHHKQAHYHHNIIAEALRASFLCTDQELKGTEAGDYVGATAVVAVVGKCHIIIAHAGDSRAVIQRGGKAESLTRDHKPDREDEAARIKAAGGRVVFSNGGHRVMGMLAMSRAIGDHFLRPYVIADPEVVCVERTPQDEVLVLATDGLWDVFSCKEATTLAIRCIGRSKERGMSRHGACRVAASVLTKVALERGSRDNITVIVVDIAMQKQHQQHCHHLPHQHQQQQQQQPQQTQPQQEAHQVEALPNPLQKQQLQKQQQTHLLEQVKQQLQQQTQQEEQAQPQATLHPPTTPPTAQLHEHRPVEQQQQQIEPPLAQGAAIGSSSSSSSTPKVPNQHQAAGVAPPPPHHLSHHHLQQQQHPQQHLDGIVPTSAAVSAPPGAPAAHTHTLLAPTSLAPAPAPLAPATPPATSATPIPPPTTNNITLPPPPMQLPKHQQVESHLQQQQQQQPAELQPSHAPNRSISFHYPHHHQQHIHPNNHHQLHTLGTCSHTTSSSSLCSHTGHASTMEQGEGHEGSACGGGAVGSKEGRGLGGKTQSFSVGTCLWLKGHHHHHHNLHGHHPKMDAATRAAVDRQRSAPNFQQQSQITGSCSQLQQLQQQQQQQQQHSQQQQHPGLQPLPPTAVPPLLSPSASAAIDAQTEQLEAVDQPSSMPAPATRMRRPSARLLPGSGGSLDISPPLASAPQPDSPASFFEPHTYFTEQQNLGSSSQPPSVLLPIATTHSMQGSISSEGGPPLPSNSAAAAAAAAAGGSGAQGTTYVSTSHTDQRSGSSSGAAEAGVPFRGESRFRVAGRQSEPGGLLIANGSRGGAPTQQACSRSRSGNGSNEQLGNGRLGIGAVGVEGRARGKSFHGDRGGDEGGTHMLSSGAAEGGNVPTSVSAAPTAPRQRQIVRRPNRPNTPTATTTAAPSLPTSATLTPQEQQLQQLPPHFLLPPDAPPLSSSSPSSYASPAYGSRPGTPVPLPPSVAIPATPAPSQSSSSDIMLSPPYPSSAPSRPGNALHQPSPLHSATFNTTTTAAADTAVHELQQQQHHHQRGVRSSCSSGAIDALLGAQRTEGACEEDGGAPSESQQHQ